MSKYARCSILCSALCYFDKFASKFDNKDEARVTTKRQSELERKYISPLDCNLYDSLTNLRLTAWCPG